MYRLTVTRAELDALRDGLVSAPGPEADEMLHGINWYVDRLPKPGQSKDDKKAEEEAETSTETPGADIEVDADVDADVDAEVDALLSEPGEKEEPATPSAEDDVQAEVDELVPLPPSVD